MIGSVLAMMCWTAYAQNLKITGTVTSVTDHESVIGATVMEKGTNNGTVTDMDGHFTLDVKPGAKLVISYIGCKPQEVTAGPNMIIKLQDDSKELNEVVVTGYTTQRKADLTGAISVMDMKTPVSTSDPNMLNSMQGKLAGVNIVTDAEPGGGNTTIRVRGMSTVNGNDPLFIIDGVPTTENLNSINPSDIESIQVLKDASSASIYGSRAANGVIIITTKKGKDGKMKLDVNYSASLQTVSKYYKMLDTGQWGEAYWAAARNSNITPSHVFYGSGPSPVLVSSLDSNGKVKASDTDWQKEIYSPAWTQNVGMTMSNSSDKSSVLFSGNFINQDGLMDYTFYRRFSARINSTYNFNKYLDIGENLMVAKWQNRGASTNSDGGVPFTAMRQMPAIPVYDSDGKFTNPTELCASDIANPVQTLYNSRNDSNDSWRIFGNSYLEVKPIDGLTIKSNIGIEHLQYLSKTLTRKVNSTDQNNVSRTYGQGDTWTWTNTANYIKTFNKVHHLNLLAGTEAIKYSYDGLSALRTTYAFEDEDYMQLDAGTGTQTNGGSKTEWALFSLFGKADYNYADKYLLSATLRRDQTSRLYTGNNSGVFPAVSGAWRISEEKFWHRNNIVNDIKFRAAWGKNGNSAISNNYASYTAYAYDLGNASYDLNGTNTNVVGGIKVSASGNKKLKWETTSQTNLGVDLIGFNNAVTLNFDYYWKLTRDMLTEPPTLAVDGENATTWQNTGNMRNNGWELTLNYHSPEMGSWQWNGSFNMSHYRNKVVKLNNFVDHIGTEERLMAGEPMGVYYGYVCDGIFQSEEEVMNHATQSGAAAGRLKYRDINGDGVINENDQCVIGDPNPDLSVGLNLDVSYKNWTLSAFFSGEFGFDIYNETKKQLDFMSYGGVSTNRGIGVLNAWSESNTSSTIPALSLSDDNDEMRMSSYFIEDGSYLKLKYLKLQYQIPENLLHKLHIDHMSIYAQCENIFTITGYSGLDPEIQLSTYGARIDNGPYPRSRNFSVGVNLGI